MRYLKFILIIVILITDTLTCFGQNSTEVPPIIQQQDNLYYELLYKDGEFTNEVNVVGWSDSITELVVPDSIEIVVPDSLLQIKNPAFKNIVPTGLGDDWPKPGDGSTRRCKIITFFPNKRFVAVPVPAPKQNISLIDLAKSLRIEGNFRDFVNLKSITLPNVKEIPDSMFMGCNALGELTIPKSVKYIHGYAFAECRNLKTVNINEGLHIIGRAFNECTSLEYVEIQGSQRRIDINSTAFYNCKELKCINIWGDLCLYGNPFPGCDNLNEISLTSKDYTVKDGMIIYEREGTLVGVYPSSIKDVVIPPSIKTIDSYAFAECKNLKHIVLPYTIQDIMDYAFAYSGLERVDTGDLFSFNQSDADVASHYQFKGCSDLKEVMIGKNFERLSLAAFSECDNFTRFIVDDYNLTFYTDGGALYSGNKLISCPSGLTNYNVKDGTTRIYFNAFNESRKLKNITLPNSINHIDDDAFYRCKALESLKIPDGVTGIFSGTFCFCSNLKSLTLGKGVQRLRDWAFFGCDNLSSLYILNPEPPTPYFQKEEDSIFPDYILNNTSLFVPDESLEAYKESSLWGKFNIISGLSAKIESIDIDNDKDTIDYNKPYVIYNLKGMKIGSDISYLDSGFYIILQGNKVQNIIKK